LTPDVPSGARQRNPFSQIWAKSPDVSNTMVTSLIAAFIDLLG
jgi:hypothetical protein